MGRLLEFFNKQDGVVEDMNLNTSEIIEGMREAFGGFLNPGFYDRIGYYTSSSVPTSSINTPIFVQGADVDHVDVVSTAPATTKIVGITPAVKLIKLIANSLWQILDTDLNSGNTEIPLDTKWDGSALSVVQPYDRYIWIIYREITDASQTRIDFDGTIHYPVKDAGYEIQVTDLAPSTWTPTDGLYIGHVNVAAAAQTYDYEGSAAPAYLGQLKGGVDAKNVQIIPNSAEKPSTYADIVDSGSAIDRTTLNDHINCIKDSTKVSPDNPHGVNPSYDSEDFTEKFIQFRNGIIQKSFAAAQGLGGTLVNASPVFQVQITTITAGVNPVVDYFAVHFNGTVYELDELPQYNAGSDSILIDFDTTTYPAAGYYKISIIDGATTPTFTATLITGINQLGDISGLYLQPESNNEIILGYVYWDTATPELTTTDQYDTGGIYIGNTIGCLNKSALTRMASETTPVAENLFTAPDTTDPENEIPGFVSTFGGGGAGTFTGIISQQGQRHTYTINVTNPGLFTIGYRLRTNGNTSKMASYVTSQFEYQPTTGKTNITRFYQNYNTGLTNELPPQLQGWFTTVPQRNAQTIFFNWEFAANGTYVIEIDGLSIVSGQIPAGGQLINMKPSSSIVYDPTYAVYGGVAIETRPEIIDRTLDKATNKTPVVPLLQQTSVATPDSSANFTTYGTAVDNFTNAMIDPTTVDNIVMIPIQGLTNEIGAGIYSNVFAYDNTKYIVVGTCFNILKGDYTFAAGVRQQQWVEIGASGVTCYAALYDAADTGITGANFYITGYIMLRRHTV